jgi:hypothetical protein
MTTADRLARRFDVSQSPLRPTIGGSTGFDRWLAAFWTPFCPPEPDTCPDAVSRLDDFGARAIRWYDLDGEVLGYLAGLPARCYRVPAGTIEPSPDEVLDEDGPVCDGDDHDVRDRADLLLAVAPVAGDDECGTERTLSRPAESRLDLFDRSGRDWLPAGDLFHRQAEGERQVVG